MARQLSSSAQPTMAASISVIPPSKLLALATSNSGSMAEPLEGSNFQQASPIRPIHSLQQRLSTIIFKVALYNSINGAWFASPLPLYKAQIHRLAASSSAMRQ